jgi:hypothetical protein
MAEEQIPQASEAQQLVLASHSVIESLQINGVKVQSVEGAWAVVEGLPTPEKIAAITEFNTNVLDKLSGMHDELLKWKTFVGDGTGLGLTEEELKDYQANNREFENVVEGISKGRQEKLNKIKTMVNGLETKGQNGIALRGKAFGQYIDNVCNNLGKNVYKKLHSLFKTKASVREAIQLINEATLERVKDKKHWNAGTFAESDVTKALKRAEAVSEPGELVFKPLLADDLKAGQYTFEASGILIKGVYSDEPFPAFRDEPEEWAPVMISASTQSDPADKNGADSTKPGEKTAGETSGTGVVGQEEPGKEGEQAEPKTPEGQRKSERQSKRKVGEMEESEEEPSTPKGKTPSRKTPSTTPRTKKRKTKDVESGELEDGIECTCKMPAEWKLMLARWDEHTFEEVHSGVLGPIYEREHYAVTDGFFEAPCTAHIWQLANALSIDMRDIKDALKLVAKIYEVTKGKKHVSIAWVDKETRDFFFETQEIEKYKRKRRVSDRFRPNLQLQFDTAVPVPESGTTDLDTNGHIYKKDHLKWIEKLGIRELLMEEMEMLQFHLRKDNMSKCGDLGNGYFTLASQLLMADPLTWLGFHEASNKHPVHLVAHPQPARYYAPGNVDCNWYEGDTEDLATTEALSSEFYLGEEHRNVSYIFLTNRKKAATFGKRFFKDANYSSISDEFEPEAAKEMGEYLLKAAGGKTPSVVYLTRQMNAFSWVIYKSGIMGKRQFSDDVQVEGQLNDDLPLNRPFATIPMSLVAVEDGMCENGVSYEVIKASHLELSPPIEGRFKDTADDTKFEGAIRLEHVGAIYDMIRCDKPPQHPAVKAEIEQWLKADANQRGELHRIWRENAAERVRVAFEQVREYEMRLFEGNKSYFRCMEEKLDQPMEEDPDYFVISDSE